MPIQIDVPRPQSSVLFPGQVELLLLPDQWLADEIDFMNAVCTEMEMECVDHMSVTDSSRKKNIRKECQQNHWDTAHCCLPGESLSKHLSQFQNTLINAKGSTLKDQ